jgi:SAM-dependent methyltransferase
MHEHPEPPPAWLLPAARHVYGADPDGYERGRPEYPARIDEVLVDPCGLAPGATVLEIGPGTGRVTRKLVDAGARVVGVEPDPVLADHLSRTIPAASLEVVHATFEAAALPGGFDLAVAATSFHWVDPPVGFPKLGRVLRPGGWAAIWWTYFSDLTRDDPFLDAAAHLMEPLVDQRRNGVWELDVDARCADLERRAGLVDVSAESLRWTHRFDTAALRSFHASTIDVARRPPDERDRMLDELTAIADREFGGVVDRPFVTTIYLGRRPSG